MARPEATVEEIVSLLPDFDEMEVLRLRLVGVAVPDPGKAWDSSSAFTTADRRLLTPERVDAVLDDTEALLQAYLASTFAAMRPVLHAFWSGRGDEASRLLVRMGEMQEESGRLARARRCYQVALSVALPLIDKRPQILALRRIGRVALAVGELPDALAYYERSAGLARDADDLLGQVIGRTGAGNVRTWQGRWADGHEAYLSALALCEPAGDDPELQLPQAQLFNNLGSTATRLERLDEAEGWFDRAVAAWERISSPYDLAVCYNNLAHLREMQGRQDDARMLYGRALALPIPSALRAGLAADLAEWHIRKGHVSQAEEWSRMAEEHAIAAGSPYILGRMYQGRGNVARGRGDDDGFIFYEKALEIAREKGYSMLEAETLMDYAQLRMQTGGEEEAQAYVERAAEVFGASGSVREQARAEALLDRLAATPPLAPAVSAGE